MHAIKLALAHAIAPPTAPLSGIRYEAIEKLDKSNIAGAIMIIRPFASELIIEYKV